jgi:eukaryotic-like serine/threonine-protein kinase
LADVMNSAHWKAVERVLDAVLEHDPSQWSARLDELCGDDTVRRDVETILRRYTSTQHFLDSPPVAAAAALVAEMRSENGGAYVAGRRVGAWRVVRQIGRGGMSRVFLAERADGQFEQRVALKLLHAGHDDPDTQLRFRAERQILAALNHPNIARLLDGGTTEDGVLYLAMEYVEGEPVDSYCDARGLSVRDRLELFTTVAEAVHFAHRNLVVHRDLKPSNILVSAAGEVKLLDFGIAKLLADGGPLALRLQTRTGRTWMTPEYAAPEQLRGESVTTATDVYQLGVVLYELLTGCRPFEESAATSVPDLIAAVLHDEPEKPSTAVSRLASRRAPRSDGDGGDGAERQTVVAPEPTWERMSRSHGTDPERLRQALRGDLDVIVLKALRKEPELRYQSAAAMAADVRRHLAGQPVEARPSTFRYRAAKFARRNRTAVALAGLAVTTLIAGLAGTIVQARRVTHQAAIAREERNRADREARAAKEQLDFALRQLSRAEAINDLNDFVLSDVAPSGKPLTAGFLLERAERLIERQHEKSDVNRADMLMAIGGRYWALDKDDEARRVLGRAYELSRTLPDRSTRAKAACALASALSRGGELDRAEALFREGLAELSDAPQFALDRVFCFSEGAEIADQREDGPAAIRWAEAAQRALQQVRYPSRAQELRVLMRVAASYSMADRFPEAVRAFEGANARLTDLGRENTATAGTLLNNWALALDLMGRPLAAESLFRRAIEINKADTTEATVSPMLLNNYARTLAKLHRLPEAADYAERAYAGAKRAGDQVVINQSLRMRAAVYRELGAYPRAAAMLAELDPRWRRMFPAGAPVFAILASEHSLLARGRGDLSRAAALADSAIRILEKSGQGADLMPILLVRRSELEFDMHRFAQARADASKALELTRATTEPGAFSADLGLCYLALGRALRAQGEVEPARAAFRSAREHLRTSLGPDHPETREAEQLIRSVSGAAGK